MSASPQADALLNNIARALREGRLQDAERGARLFLQSHPHDEGGLTLLALSLQLQNRFTEAADTYRYLCVLYPQSPIHWNNLGTVLREAGQSFDAEAAYLKGLDIAPRDFGSLMNVGFLMMERGAKGFARNYFLRAHDVDPATPDARIYAAQMAYAVGDHDQARELLQPWRQWIGLNDELSLELATLLLHFDDAADGAAIFQRLVDADPHNQRARSQLVIAYERINRLDDARRLAAELPSPDSVANADVRDDVVSAHAALAMRESDGANARRLLEDLSHSLKRGSLGSIAVYFSLAKACDRVGDFDAAMTALATAHRTRLESLQQDIPDLSDPDAEQLHIATFHVSEDDRRAWPDLPAPSMQESPIFIVGFPRSGTTMLELMLDAHPTLQSMDERSFLQNVVDRMSDFGLRYPHDLAKLTHAQCDDLRSVYWKNTAKVAPLREGQRLVDKNPLNMLRLPLINRLFPNAPIVLALRHPCDVVMSCYMQNFGAPAFAMLCSTLPRLARGYITAMDFWIRHTALLNPTVMNLRYEDLLSDFATYAQRIATFVGLDDAESLQNFHSHAQAKGFISTPSYTQVIEPPNTKAVGRWKHYESYFRDALPILQPMIEHWGYA